jgi:hypothetical protein
MRTFKINSFCNIKGRTRPNYARVMVGISNTGTSSLTESHTAKSTCLA